MTDEQNELLSKQKQAEGTPMPEQPDPQPVDTPVEQNPAHPVDEDPEQHLGDEINDPWDDETQTDWPNGSVDYPGVSN